MKKIILLFVLGFVLNSCSTDTNNQSYQFYLLPVSAVQMPETFSMNNVTNIVVKYKRPTSCHFFSDFNYKSEGFTRTIAIECAKIMQDNCQPDNETEVAVNLPFKPTEAGTYHFKFWKGANSQGIDEFFEYDVSVNY